MSFLTSLGAETFTGREAITRRERLCSNLQKFWQWTTIVGRDTSLLLPGNAGYLLLQPFFDAASAAIRWCWIWTNQHWQLSCIWQRHHDTMILQGGGRRNHHFLGAGHLRLLRGLCAQSHLRQASTIRSVQLPNTSPLLHFIRLIQTLNQYSWQCSGPLPQIAQLHRVSTNIRTGGQNECDRRQ